MASARKVMDELCNQIRTALSTVPGVVTTGTGLNVHVAPGWPPVTTLSNVAKGGPSIVNVYDHQHSKDVTRFMPFVSGEVLEPCKLVTSLTKPLFNDKETITLTLGNTEHGTLYPYHVGNAFSLLLFNGRQYGGDAVTMTAADVATNVPLTAMCARLVSILQANSVLSTWATFKASGATIEITNKAGVQLIAKSYVGSFSTISTEVHREMRYLQCNTWTRTEELRELISEPIDKLFAQLQANYGFMVGTDWVRVHHEGDIFMEDDVLKDVYRRMFLINTEYGTTVEDYAYSVLVPIALLEADVGITP